MLHEIRVNIRQIIKTKKEAKAAYFANFDSNWHGFMHITGVSLTTFKKWLYRGRKQRQPFADYVEIQKKKLNEERERELKDIMGDLSWTPVSRGDGKMNLYNEELDEYLSPEWFNWCGNMDNGIALVRNDDGDFNYLKDDGTLILPEWYYDCAEFGDKPVANVAKMTRDGIMYNRVDRHGNLGDWKFAR